jgi:3-oxoacyl-[acyl-carrier protein] reductase
LVTGASTGIGAALARAFAESGASVVVHYNNSVEQAQAVARDVEAAGSRAALVQGDVAKPEQVQRIVDAALDAFGKIDVLINNAGGLIQRRAVADVDGDLYDTIMDVNTRSVFEFCRRVVPIMQRQGHGNIINLTSISARNGGGGGSVIYSASKGAVSTLTRGLAKELAGQNIRVNAISPGLILTPFHERYTEPERMQQLITTIPMGRAGTAEECVGTAFYLASDALSGYVTGQIIEVNGGQLMP